MQRAQIAERLSQAARTLTPIPAFSTQGEGFSIEEAYEIQWLVVQDRLARGEHLAGVKVGLTSEAKQRQLGLDSPVYGWLTDSMLMHSGAEVNLARQIHPRIEPEIGFLLGPDQVVAAVFGAFELVDSRYEAFKFGMADVIADNTSAAGAVLGERVSPEGIDLRAVHCSLRLNGREIAQARGEAVLGDPRRALAWVLERVGQAKRPLPEGSLVLSGSLTEFVPLGPGDVVEAVFDSLGKVTVSGS